MRLAQKRAEVDVRRLAEGEVLLVCARLDRDPPAILHLEGLLSRPERANAARFVRAEDRSRAVLARGLLKVVLGEVTGVPPSAIELATTAEGKPFLEGGPSFNVAHSSSWVVVGLAPRGRLGVDVEARRSLTDMDGLVARFFAPEEVAAYEALPVGERAAAFFRAWARKEALLKARGGGLSIPLDSFAVSLAPEPRTTLLRHAWGPEEVWSVRSVPVDPDMEAAVAWDRAEEPAVRLEQMGVQDL